ncbi:MAG: hypothetical protein WC460_06050 [Patescibacteria group bacterium]
MKVLGIEITDKIEVCDGQAEIIVNEKRYEVRFEDRLIQTDEPCYICRRISNNDGEICVTIPEIQSVYHEIIDPNTMIAISPNSKLGRKIIRELQKKIFIATCNICEESSCSNLAEE